MNLRDVKKTGNYLNIVSLCLITLILHVSIYAQVPKGSKSHRHPGISQTVEVEIPDFSMLQTSIESDLKRENLVTTQDKKHDAFTVSDTRLFVLDKETKRLFEIKGLPLEWRPFSDLSWKDNQILMFDRWSQPHYGVHYSVNVKTRQLTVAAPFGDQPAKKL